MAGMPEMQEQFFRRLLVIPAWIAGIQTSGTTGHAQT